MSTADLQDRLRDTLHARVDPVSAPSPDLPALARAGARQRTLRSAGAAVVVAVAVVAAVLAGTQLTGAPGLPQGGPPVVSGGATGPERVAGPTRVFVTRDGSYVEGRRSDVRLPWGTGAHIGQGGVAYPQPGTHRPFLLDRRGEARPLAPPSPSGGATYGRWVVADGSGPLVAWAEENKGRLRTRFVVVDSGTGREVAQRALACDRYAFEPEGGDSRRLSPGDRPAPGEEVLTECPWPYVLSDGTVFYRASDENRAWDVASDEVRVVDGDVAQAHRQVVGGFEDLPIDPGTIGPGWQFAEQPPGYEGILSYDGGWILDNGGQPRIVNWRNPDQSIRYRPPGTVRAATFDTDGSVLVVTRDEGRWSGWDCAPQQECERVVGPQDGEIRLVGWDL